MRKLILPLFLIIGAVTHHSNQANVEGICDYYYYSSNYYCGLHDFIISSPDDVLIITGNHLPNHTDADVQMVTHRNASFAYFNGEVLRKFTNLEYLEIRSAGVRQISQNAFDVCGKLDHVHIGSNSLETFPPGMLKNCNNLRQFHSYFNNLTSIPEDLFGATTNLEIFEASNSHRLDSLPRDLLRNMRNLTTFLIQSNLIANIDSNLLANAANLETVNLSDNPISNVSVIINLLDGHLALSSIMLNRIPFAFVDFDYFSQFNQLNNIELNVGGGSLLTRIKWKALPPSLASIYVSNIGEDVPKDAFDHLTNLKSLGFSGAGITNLHDDTFKSLVNLNSLSIQSTGIRTIPSNIFANQANLTQLYLSYCAIEELPEGLFAPLVNLGLNTLALANDLNLSGNRIRRLNANSFGYHPHLRNLLLAFNEIAEIDREIFARLPNIMETVDLTSNNCTDTFFLYESNLQNDTRLEDCFNNWAGITTTMAPGSAFKIGAGFSLSLMTIILIIF